MAGGGAGRRSLLHGTRSHRHIMPDVPAATGYRMGCWVVLAVLTLVNVTIQTLWIGYAPITGRRLPTTA